MPGQRERDLQRSGVGVGQPIHVPGRLLGWRLRGVMCARLDAVRGELVADVRPGGNVADDLNMPLRVQRCGPLLWGVRADRGGMCRHVCRAVFRSGDVGGTLGVSLCLLRRGLLGGLPAGVHAVRRGRCGDMYRERDVGGADGLPLRVLNRCVLGDMHPDRDQVQRQ